MPKREVVQSITLGRGNKRIQLKYGQVFDFTDAELAEIMKVNPNAVSAKVTVDLDSDEDATEALREREVQLSDNEVSAPSTREGSGKKTSGKKAAGEDL